MTRVKASVYDESGTKKVSPLPKLENARKYEEGRTCTARTGAGCFYISARLGNRTRSRH